MAFSVVQAWATHEGGGSATSVAITLTSAPTVGNLVIVAVCTNASTATGLTVKDGNSNNYTATTSSLYGSGDGSVAVGIYYWVAAGTPNKTITASWTGSGSFPDIWAIELSGNAASPFEADATHNYSSANTSVILPSLTTVNNGDYLVAIIGTDGASAVSSANSPWTLANTVGGAGDAVEYYQQTTAGARAVNFTMSSGQSNVLLAAFKPAATAATPKYARLRQYLRR